MKEKYLRCQTSEATTIRYFAQKSRPAYFAIRFRSHKIEELLTGAHELGLEGLIGKRSGSPYEAGKRSGAGVKIKLYQEQSFVIGGYTEPEESRKHFGVARWLLRRQEL